MGPFQDPNSSREDPGVGDMGGTRVDQQGVKVLGTLLGSPEFVRARLLEFSASLDWIPHVSDLQFGVGCFCHSARLRARITSSEFCILRPHVSSRHLHDTAIRRCVETLLDVRMDDQSVGCRQFAVEFGGLGLRSTVRGRSASALVKLGRWAPHDQEMACS